MKNKNLVLAMDDPVIEGKHEAAAVYLGADVEDEILEDSEDDAVVQKKSVLGSSQDDALVLAERQAHYYTDAFDYSGENDSECESDVMSVILPDMDLSFLRESRAHHTYDPELIDADDEEDEILYGDQSLTEVVEKTDADLVLPVSPERDVPEILESSPVKEYSQAKVNFHSMPSEPNSVSEQETDQLAAQLT